MDKYTLNRYRINPFKAFLMRLGIIRMPRPWERKGIPAWQRAQWIASEPKSLKKVG